MSEAHSTAATILVVEDEPDIADAVRARLLGEGFRVTVATDGPSAVETALSFDPDLILLDLNLPGFDGLEVCRRVHAVKRIPVIMVTARDDESDMLVGLGIGADDYLTKPFSMKELVARVRVVLRRAQPDQTPSTNLTYGDLQLDVDRRLTTYAETPVHLTPTEFDILRTLLETNGGVLSREALLNRIWGYNDSNGIRTVDSHVRSIRRKTGDEVIRTVHGVGYAAGVDPS